MRLYLISIILICISAISYSQSITIKGSVTNKKNNSSIPFVNIGLKGTYHGTTTNLNGDFEIKLPSNKKYRTLVISCIGYENREIKVSANLSHLNIALTPLTYDISEVTIMPDSTLRSFLLKAYRKIPDNYPNYPTRYEGFYRASIQNEEQEYNRFMEVLTEFYKSSYKSKESGTVKVIKSRKFVSEKEYNGFPVVFYGGIHTCHYRDIVKERSDLLKGSKHYSYKLIGNTKYNNRLIYIIEFSPAKENSNYSQGTMYIDSESLAYIKVESKSTIKQNKKRSQATALSLNGIKSISRSKTINYSNIDGRYFLKSIYDRETFQNKDSAIFICPVEYIVTSVTKDSVEKIAYNEIVPITYTPAIEAQNYQDSNWKDYGTLPLNSKVNLDSLKQSNAFKEKKITMHKLIYLFQKINVEIGIGVLPVSTKIGNYQLNYQHLQYNKNIESFNYQLSYFGNIGYKLTPKNLIEYSVQKNLSKHDFIKTYSFRYKHIIPIKNMGRNISAQLNVGWEWQKNGFSLGTQTSNTDFKFGGKNFKNKKIQAYAGTKTHGLTLGGGFNFQLSNFIHLSLAASYFSPVKTEDVIILKERSGFILGRKKANEPISNSDISYSIDGLESPQSGFKKENWNLLLGLSLKF